MHKMWGNENNKSASKKFSSPTSGDSTTASSFAEFFYHSSSSSNSRQQQETNNQFCAADSINKSSSNSSVKMPINEKIYLNAACAAVAQAPFAHAPATFSDSQVTTSFVQQSGCDKQSPSCAASSIIASSTATSAVPRSTSVIPVAPTSGSQMATSAATAKAPSISNTLSGVHLVPKELEQMMRRCYDLSVTPRPHNFPRQPFSSPTVQSMPTPGHFHQQFPPNFAPSTSVSSTTANNIRPPMVAIATESQQYVAQSMNYASMSSNPVFVIPSCAPILLPSSYVPYAAPFPQQVTYVSDFRLPACLTDLSKIPPEYVKHLHNCCTPKAAAAATGATVALPTASNSVDDYPDTRLVYLLLKTSGLSNEVLGAIWANVNRTQPGLLTKFEFFASLALVAIAQKTGKVYPLEALTNYPDLPIPYFENGCTFPTSTTATFAVSTDAAPANNATNINNKANSDAFAANSRINSNIFINPSNSFVSSKNEDTEEFSDFTDFQSSASNSNTTSATNPKNLNFFGKHTKAFFEPCPGVNASEKSKSSTTAFNVNPKNFDLNLLSNNKNNGGDATDNKFTQELESESSGKLVRIFASKSLDNSTPNENNSSKTADKINRFETNFKDICFDGKTNLFISPFSDDVDEKASSGFSSAISNGHGEQRGSSSTNNNYNNQLQEARQNFSFADIGNDTLAVKTITAAAVDTPSDSCSLKSKEPSLHSLDLRSVKTVDSNDEGKDLEFGIDNFDYERRNSNNFALISSSNSLCDKYAAVREIESISFEEKHTFAWGKVLTVCNDLIQEAVEKIVSCSNNDEETDEEEGRKLLVECDRGAKYLKSIIEIYAVAKRIKISLKAYAFQIEASNVLLSNIESCWRILQELFGFSDLMPDPSEFDFSDAILKADSHDDQQRACGICLLNVDYSSGRKSGGGKNPPQSSAKKLFQKRLTYSGRHYHSQCANLWVNKVDFLLPALRIPGLLD